MCLRLCAGQALGGFHMEDEKPEIKLTLYIYVTFCEGLAIGVPMQTVNGCVHPLHVLQCIKGEQQFEQWHPSSCPDSSHSSPFSQNRHLSTRNTGMVESAMTIIANIIERCFIYYLLFVLAAKLVLILIRSKFFCFHFWLLSCVICYRPLCVVMSCRRWLCQRLPASRVDMASGRFVLGCLMVPYAT